jgi:cell wall-associated NlpC family hydrolase
VTTRAAIVAEAMTWLKTPYHHRARKKGAGVDCAMLLIGIFSGVGLIDEFEPDEYPRDWMMHRSEERFRNAVIERADPIDGTDLQPGDVALYKVGRCFAHGAVVIEWPVVIHADSRFGKVTLTEGNQGWLSGRDVEFYRVKGLS